MEESSFNLQLEAEILHAGGEAAFAELFIGYRERLLRLIRFRLDVRLQRRLDPEDILQEAYLDAVNRLDHYIDNPQSTLYLWLRLVVCQTMINVHRRHVGAKMRDATREVTVQSHGSTSLSITAHLIGKLTSPSQAAIRSEMSVQLEEALASMSEIDREVLALRHFEELSNKEVSTVLGIETQTASVRYFRAIRRLQAIFEKLPEVERLFFS